MRTLVIDTVAAACSVALFDGEETVDFACEHLGRGHAERLVPMISQLPERGRADRIAVDCGPGSFTGVRIGLSVARALGLAWQAELVGYCSLDLLIAKARSERGADRPVAPVMIGGHGEFFCAFPAPTDTGPVEPLSLPPDALAERVMERTVVGNARQRLEAIDAADWMIAEPDARDFSLLSTEHHRAVEPIYGRPPDAKPQVRTASR